MKQLTDDDRAQIHVLIRQAWPAAVVNKDWDSLGKLCAEDINYLPQDHPIVQGREAVCDFLAGFPPLTELEQTCDYAEGDTSCVVTRGVFKANMELEEGVAHNSGKYLATLRKEGADWVATSVCFNWDAPMGVSA